MADHGFGFDQGPNMGRNVGRHFSRNNGPRVGRSNGFNMGYGMNSNMDQEMGLNMGRATSPNMGWDMERSMGQNMRPKAGYSDEYGQRRDFSSDDNYDSFYGIGNFPDQRSNRWNDNSHNQRRTEGQLAEIKLPGDEHFLTYKNSLLEHCQKRSLGTPVYACKMSGNEYFGSVEIDTLMVRSNLGQDEQKDAEQAAAFEALKKLGYLSDDALFNSDPGKTFSRMGSSRQIQDNNFDDPPFRNHGPPNRDRSPLRDEYGRFGHPAPRDEYERFGPSPEGLPSLMNRPFQKKFSGNPYADVVGRDSKADVGRRPQFSRGNQFQEDRGPILRDGMSRGNQFHEDRGPFIRDGMSRGNQFHEDRGPIIRDGMSRGNQFQEDRGPIIRDGMSRGNQFQEDRGPIIRDGMNMLNKHQDPYRHNDSILKPLGIQPGVIPRPFWMQPEKKRKEPIELDLGPGHISFKNQLNEFLMKEKRDMPTYSHKYVAGLGFLATVYFDDKEFNGIAYQKSKKDAEQDACHNALYILGLVDFPPDPNENLNKKLREEAPSSGQISTKNRLQEYAQKAKVANPTYSTERVLSGSTNKIPDDVKDVVTEDMPFQFGKPQYVFISTVTVNDKDYLGEEKGTKKAAEQSAATTALKELTGETMEV